MMVRAWEADESCEEDAREYDGMAPEDVAEQCARYRFSRADYPEVQKIAVRDPFGALYVFWVRAEQVVEFHAIPAVDEPGCDGSTGRIDRPAPEGGRR